jgi:hypothetical protein
MIVVMIRFLSQSTAGTRRFLAYSMDKRVFIIVLVMIIRYIIYYDRTSYRKQNTTEPW